MPIVDPSAFGPAVITDVNLNSNRIGDAGAQALAAGPAGIVAGGSADLVLLDPAHPAFAAREEDRILDSLVFAARDGAIREVYARGRRVVADGVHPARAAAEARVARVLARVLAA